MSKQRRIQLLAVTVLLVTFLSACSGDTYTSPLYEGHGTAWFQWIVEQVANLTVWFSQLAGGLYWVGLIIVTLIVRTVGWPIYAKSNQTTVNMQQAQPALEELREKYKGRTDEASQRKMQMETMAIYKEYGINPLGCLLPFLQMPIFIAMYQVVRRIPLTPIFQNGGAEELKFNFLWISDLGGKDQFYILPILVGLIMFFSQQYTMKKPEYMKNKKYQQNAQAKQSENTMKIMSYVMVGMLVLIAIDNAGIALYWIVGTGYQFLQTYLNRQKTAKRFADK